MAHMWRRRILYPLFLWIILTAVITVVWTRFGTYSLTTVLTIVSTLVALMPVLKVGPLSWSPLGRPSNQRQVEEAAQALQRLKV